jgi:gentisate 1,2-dioxygenase
MWRSFENTGPGDAILYSVCDEPAQQKLALFRAQGKNAEDALVDITRWPDFD